MLKGDECEHVRTVDRTKVDQRAVGWGKCLVENLEID